MSAATVEALAKRIDLRQVRLLEADRYYAGQQPLAYLSPAARRSLGNRLAAISANYVRLATDSVAERLQIEGFRSGSQTLTEVWTDWTRSGMPRLHRVAILEALITGQSFLTTWANDTGQPVISVDSPREMAVMRHPLTHQVSAALKRWRDDDGTARAVLFQADQITCWTGPYVPEGGALPSTHWTRVDTLTNPLGVVPVVDLTNSGRLFDGHGTPEARDIWTLVDALSKILSDVLVASESTALPRRWATGLAVVEDEYGVPQNPFSAEPGSVWQSEDPNTNFGSFPEPSLAGYDALVTMLIRQIGAVAGLPDFLIGIQGVDPSSADQIRASETSLVSRAYGRQTTFSQAFDRVAALCEAIRTGGPVRTDITTVWKSPESRTRAAEADAAAKLYAARILPLETVWQDLGYSPEEIDAMRKQNVRQALDASPLALPAAAVNAPSALT